MRAEIQALADAAHAAGYIAEQEPLRGSLLIGTGNPRTLRVAVRIGRDGDFLGADTFGPSTGPVHSVREVYALLGIVPNSLETGRPMTDIRDVWVPVTLSCAVGEMFRERMRVAGGWRDPQGAYHAIRDDGVLFTWCADAREWFVVGDDRVPFIPVPGCEVEGQERYPSAAPPGEPKVGVDDVHPRTGRTDAMLIQVLSSAARSVVVVARDVPGANMMLERLGQMAPSLRLYSVTREAIRSDSRTIKVITQNDLLVISHEANVFVDHAVRTEDLSEELRAYLRMPAPSNFEPAA